MPIKGVWEETVWQHILFENIKDRNFCLQCYLLSLNNGKKRELFAYWHFLGANKGKE